MNPRAVIYCSKHGSTKQIAKMIADKYNLPLINIMHINGYSFQEVPVIFCGWIKKGKIQGLVKAENLFSCIEIVAVGSMPSNESSRLKLKYENNIAGRIGRKVDDLKWAGARSGCTQLRSRCVRVPE